jgi:hypothetical protein
MRKLYTVIAVTGSALAAVGSASVASAADAITVKLIETSKNGDFQILTQDKNTGRLEYRFSFHAENKQVQGGDLLDASTNTGQGYADLIRGNGLTSGMDLYEKDGSKFNVSWAGQCYQGERDGKSGEYCSGSWSVVPSSGTGGFAGLSGGGEWRSQSLPTGEYVVEKQGSLLK